MAIEYFCCYHSYLEAMEQLNDAEKGRLFTACLQYSMTGEAPQLSGNERYVFPTFKSQIDRDRERRHCGKGIKHPKSSGENHWNWKGGKTPQNQVARRSIEYREWRESVFARDNYTCQICGQHGGKLNAHHKKQWSKFPEYRFDVDNGITLCSICHKAVHKAEARMN